MSPFTEARDAAHRTKAEELFAQRERQGAERLSDQARERQAQEQKTVRLRELRLARDAADRKRAIQPVANKPATPMSLKGAAGAAGLRHRARGN